MLLPSIIQAIGLVTISIGLGLVFIPAGVTAFGISLLLVGISLERSK